MAWEDDPSVPPARSREVSDQLGAAVEIMPRGGRLNDVAGFTRFPQLRDGLLDLLVWRLGRLGWAAGAGWAMNDRLETIRNRVCPGAIPGRSGQRAPDMTDPS